ncbi:hypothetical protein CDCA_CDCA15G4025 [Cyanidium caldarium]|uniref:AAA+ ATPase domain-containing protein n=1 Tax=Cyanidium caldarium TaxID=2771 RepID=A0AAV9J0X8_CYACA|nr:hypothetical protein CDCA_CDCA15G4025 [Cyanidium caldarium]
MTANGNRGCGGSSASQAFIIDLLYTTVSLACVWFAASALRRSLDPLYGSRRQNEARRRELEERLARQRSQAGQSPVALPPLSATEVAVAQYLVDVDELDVRGLDDVGGHEETKQALRELVILPFQHPELFTPGSLLQPPRGVLLYGPPGTGKTMLAKALAAESGAFFLNVAPSTLLSKWVGETQQLTRAIFSLAHKLQPCIVFIDEIDALFRTRAADDHEVYRDFKAEMMQLWDGLTTDPSAQILLLGATNRPWDVDTAIQRRMPRSFLVDLPDRQQRREILRVILRQDAHRVAADLDACAAMTEEYSGSDLKELCRAAAQLTLRDALREVQGRGRALPSTLCLRHITLADFQQAMRSVPPTGMQSELYYLQQLQAAARRRKAAQDAAPRDGDGEPATCTVGDVDGAEELDVNLQDLVSHIGRRVR